MEQVAVPAFVALAMHIGHKGDHELQDEECGELANYAIEFGLATGMLRPQVLDLIDEAAVRYFESDNPAKLAESCADHIEEASMSNPDLLNLAYNALVKVAEAHGGILPEENSMLQMLAARWSI